jgi:hypothetical protein
MRWAMLALVTTLAACRPSPEQCARLLDHFLDVEGDAATAGQFREMSPPLTAALAESKRRFAAQLHDAFVAQCRRELSPAEVACAMAAVDEAGLDRCEGR